MSDLDLSTKKVVSILLLQQQILLLNLIKRRQYQVQGFAAFLNICLFYGTRTSSWSAALLLVAYIMSVKGTDPRKTLILPKRTWYLDPRIIKLCFSKSMSWHILNQPPNGAMQKSCSENFRKIHRKTFVVQTFFNKVAGFERSPPRVFSCKLSKNFRTAFLLNNSGQLLWYLKRNIFSFIETREHTVDFSWSYEQTLFILNFTSNLFQGTLFRDCFR